jgi:hypothetical protein
MINQPRMNEFDNRTHLYFNPPCRESVRSGTLWRGGKQKMAKNGKLTKDEGVQALLDFNKKKYYLLGLEDGYRECLLEHTKAPAPVTEAEAYAKENGDSHYHDYVETVDFDKNGRRWGGFFPAPMLKK